MKKVTIQDIADEAGVSRVTVWKVMNGQKGVSEATREKILQKASELKYNIADAIKRDNILMDKKEDGGIKVSNIAVIAARPETSVFWMKILNQISAELSKHDLHCIYINLMLEDFASFKMPQVIKNGDVQGMIIINAYDERVIKILSESEIPKVFMDGVNKVPFREMNGDMIILDGKDSVYEITDSIIKRGRTEIGFIGDIDYAISNYTRWKGFCLAMEKNNLSINKNFCFTSGFEIENYRGNIEKFISQLKCLPQAFVCASDYIAYILISILNQKGYRIPEDIAVSGYDNNREILMEDSFLTTVDVQKDLLGKRLVAQLLYRIGNPESDYEIIKINSKVCFKKSTDF